jgi:putative sterol carrier protein
VIDFLADDWFDRLREGAHDLPRVEGASADVLLKVPKTPAGDLRVRLVLTDGRIELTETDPSDDPTLAVSCSYDVATAVARGDLSVSVAFMRGELKVDGDMAAMHRILPLTDDVPFVSLLATLAADTRF